MKMHRQLWAPIFTLVCTVVLHLAADVGNAADLSGIWEFRSNVNRRVLTLHQVFGLSLCQQLTGTLDAWPVVGQYCPELQHRVTFDVFTEGASEPWQIILYVGSVSDDLRSMAGTLFEWGISGAASLSACRTSPTRTRPPTT